VLVHGGAGTRRVWDPVLPRLEARHEVLAVSLVGHWGGPDPDPSRGGEVAELVDAVAGEMDAAGFETAHVAGASLGAWVALELARRGRARSVVCLSPAAAFAGPRRWGRVAGLYLVLYLGARLTARWAESMWRRPGIRRLLLWHHFAHPRRLTPRECAETQLGAANYRGIRRFMVWTYRHGGIRDLHEIRCPVLLAFPERDFVVPRRLYGQPLLAGLPQASAIDLPGVGHVPQFDDPDLVARTILDFVAARVGERV
jgi:pimeloyl-ACP methyl ester carboxylesterase